MVKSPSPMFCPKCGASVCTSGRFCSSCGEAVNRATGATLFGDEASLEGAAIAPSIPAPRKTPPPPYSLELQGRPQAAIQFQARTPSAAAALHQARSLRSAIALWHWRAAVESGVGDEEGVACD